MKGRMTMTTYDYDEFMARVRADFPKATVMTDNENQLVIYTNLQLNDDYSVSEFEIH